MYDLSDWVVLIVDDELDNIGVAKIAFEFSHARVITAESGEACLAILQTKLPNVLLVDIQMPGMSGFEVLRCIRRDARFDPLVVVAVTAHAMEEDERHILQSGFDGYIAKPVNVMTIVKQVREFVSRKQARQQDDDRPVGRV